MKESKGEASPSAVVLPPFSPPTQQVSAFSSKDDDNKHPNTKIMVVAVNQEEEEMNANDTNTNAAFEEEAGIQRLFQEQEQQQTIEHLAKTLFLQIDPILRLLLCVLNSYQKKEYLQVANAIIVGVSSSSQPKQQKQHEQQLGMLQMQAKLLDRFQTTLLAFRQEQQQQANQQQQQSPELVVAQSMLLVMEYISLPLLTILRMSHDDVTTVNNDDDNDTGLFLVWKTNLKSSQDCILQSAIYKIWAKTALIIQWIIETTSTTSLSSSCCCCLTVEMQIQFIVACATVLPSGKQIQSQQQQQQDENNILLLATTTSSLDRGEDCLCALLQTLQVLVQNDHDHGGSQNNNNQQQQQQQEHQLQQDHRAMQIITTMNGALLARVVDSCMALIAPPPPPPTNSSSSSSPIWNNDQNDTVKNAVDYFSIPLQLQAIETLQSWMNMSTRTTTLTKVGVSTSSALILWRRFFPGCFSGLYRRLLSALRTTRQSSRLAVATIRTLSMLLRLTLLQEDSSPSNTARNNSNKDTTTTNGKDLILASLQSLSIKATLDKTKTTATNETATTSQGGNDNNDKEEDQDEESTIFFTQVQERLPGPLLTLIHLLSVNPSCDVRLVTVENLLNVLIQITMRHGRSTTCNSNSSNNNNAVNGYWSLELQTAVLDSCVMLSRDQDSDVALAANRVLLQETTTTSNGNNDSTSTSRMGPCKLIINRLETLLTELHGQVVMGQQQQQQFQVELCAHFRYITGYLHFGTTLAMTKKRTRKELKSSLLMLLEEENSQVCRCLLQELFRVDVKRLQDTSVLLGTKNRSRTSTTVSEERRDQLLVVIEPNASSPETTSAVLLWYPPLCRSLDYETLPMAVEMVRLLGKALGPKSAAVLVDGVIAELFQTAIDRHEQQRKQQAQQQFRNMSLSMSLSSLKIQTAGTVTSRNNNVGYGDDENTIGSLRFCQELLIGAFDNDQSESKEKCERILFSVATAVVPVLVSHPLFPCSTKSSTSTRNNSSGSTFGKNYGESVENASMWLVRRKGQACRILALLDLIQSMFVRLHQNNARDLLPAAMYPVLLSSQSVDCNIVCEMATFALEQMAVGCGFANLSGMMAFCMPSLVSTILGKLRLLQGGRSSSLSLDSMDDGLISIVKTTTMMLQMTISSTYQDDELSPAPGLENVMQVISVHLDRFDHVLAVISVDANLATSFLELFEAALLHLFAWLGSKTKKFLSPVKPASSENSPSKKATATWLSWLPKMTSRKSRPETCHRTVVNHEDEDSSEAESGMNKDEPKPQQVNGLVSLYETNFAASILRRASYLLAHESLAVQLSSCRVLIKGFSFLGRVASLSNPGEEANGAYNAILRRSAESWPSVSTRLKATVSVLPLSNKVTSLVIKPTTFSSESAANYKTHGQARLYLVQLTGLIVEMAVNSGDDFMASRLREDVWPCLMQILRSYDCDNQGEGRSLMLYHETLGRSSNRELLIAVIRCFERIFDFRPVALALSGLIPTSAALLLPLLSSPDVLVVAASMDALKAMILIDCDALRRPLWEMTATPLPRSPFLMIRNTHETCDKLSKYPMTTVSSKGAQELVDFINSLPEQELE